MTIHARSPRTLAVERHNDALWLCAVGSGPSQLLAQFSCEANVEAFKELQAQALAYAHQCGASGI